MQVMLQRSRSKQVFVLPRYQINKATARRCDNCAKPTMQSEQRCDGSNVGVARDKKKSRGLSAEQIGDTKAADSAKCKGRIAATVLQGGSNK